MLKAGGAKILPVVPQLIIPLKTALNTRDHGVSCPVSACIYSNVGTNTNPSVASNLIRFAAFGVGQDKSGRGRLPSSPILATRAGLLSGFCEWTGAAHGVAHCKLHVHR